ncbi:MAG: hypothetical protein CMP22_02790 [Rickettsiales bacterium]|nr:hypothetical protein [Rickettsiales bacterium]
MKDNRFLTRMMSALVVLPIFFGAIFLGDPYLFIFVTLIAMLAIFEFIKLVKISLLSTQIILILLMPVILTLLSIPSITNDIITKTFIITGLISGLYIILIKLDVNNQIKLTFYGLLGLIYISGAIISGLSIYNNYDISLIVIIMIGIFLTDTSAFIVGISLGKHPLVKKISPNKTIEGSVGSFIITTLFFIFVFSQNLAIFTSIVTTILFSTVLNITAQFGDIIISTLKRKAKVKNTGIIMPGHGGCLDRIDSILLSLITINILLWSII